MDPIETDVLVAGGGVSGLMAARRLQEAGFAVIVIEAGEVAGGRLATRQMAGGSADSGAQFFTVRDDEFRVEVDRWLAARLVYEWSRGWSDGSLIVNPPDGFPRYAARGGFGTLAGHLARGLNIRYSRRLLSILYASNRWQATDEMGGQWQSRGLIMTPPVPQSLELLDRGEVGLSDENRAALDAFRYAPCLCGLFFVVGETTLPPSGALQLPGHPITWIADNRHKGISPDARIITVHAAPEASAERWHQADDEVLTWMAAEIEPWLGGGVEVREARLERWSHAVPTAVYPQRCLFSEVPGPVAFTGDAFAGPRVEGAVLSGWAAADALLDGLKS